MTLGALARALATRMSLSTPVAILASSSLDWTVFEAVEMTFQTSGEIRWSNIARSTAL